jgi:myo-inositol catabolism protein IolC
MSRGYSSPLYALPCDQRNSLVEDVFGWREPLDARQLATVAAVKGVLYAGFRRAADETMTKREALLVCDDEYGAPTLEHAIGESYLTALSLERDDGEELRLAHEDVRVPLTEWRTSFAKLRLRFVAAGDDESRVRVLALVRRTLLAASERDRLTMLELDTPAEELARNIEAIQDAGIDPDVWVVPPPRHDGELVSALVRRDGRDDVSCLVRVDAGSPARMQATVEEAARIAAFVGFALAPGAFADVAAAFRGEGVSFADWSERVARRYGACIEWFRSARIDRQTATGAFLA